MQHPDEGTIHAWLDGALSADEAARVDAHVNECAQCQAAVAEARGFIAASSRILTALDNVPRGVIPSAAASRRVQPWVWRVAATVLVVAGATLVLVKRRDVSTYSETSAPVSATEMQASTPTSADSAAVPQPAPSVGALNAPAAIRPFSPQPMPSEPRSTGKRLPQSSAQTMKSAAAAKRVDEASDAPNRENAAALDRRRFGAVEQNRLESAAQKAAPTLVAPPSGVVMDEAETTPRAVATKRMIGRTQTFYELVPGDTVMLEEQFSVELGEVVVTGAATKRAQALSGRAAGQAAAAPETQPKAAAAVAPTPPPVALQDAQSSEIHRISWLDRSSGRVLILSGRHSQQELERIREKIQEMRDAAQPKRNPE
jgi:anti-sigma factor RsiW